ncbi:MAG TPA: hypothetical protein VHE81_02795 [Lacipirellulaceae bacterium]|nr:hypothetical protein [Lacipirellulaceae bacterium]
MAVLSAGCSTICVYAEGANTNSTVAETAHSTAASVDDIHRWIDELDHDVYSVRHDAAAQLLAAGISARKPLQALVNGPDPETRAAARRLIALIDQSEFHRRLEAFAADTDGKQGATLPGWEQFQKLVGSDPAARALFVDMQRQEGTLLATALDAGARSPGDIVQSRLQRLIQSEVFTGNRSASPALGSCATMVFLGSLSEIGISDQSAVLINVLCQRQPIGEIIRSEHREDAVRRLVVGWLLHCPVKNEQVLRQRLDTVKTDGIDEALPLAVSVISGRPLYKSVHPNTRAMAALVIGQLGNAELIDRVEPLLEDVSICFPPQGQLLGQRAPAVQVRDVALVVLLQLTGQRPADYGYTSAQLQLPIKAYLMQSLYRDNDQQRAESIAKWRQWRANRPNSTAAAKAD